MGKQQEFPITIKAGSTAIKIYRSPLLVRVLDPKTAIKKAYDSFLVAYYRGGKRHRIRCKSLELVQAQAHRRISSNTVAKQCLSAFSVGLDSAVREYVDARAILGEASIAEAMRFFDRFGRTPLCGRRLQRNTSLI
jgi:hypothetical protein